MICNPTPDQSGNRLRAFVRARLTALQITQTSAERRGRLHRGFLGDLLRGQKQTVHAGKVASLALALEVPVTQLAAVMSEDVAAAQQAVACVAGPPHPAPGTRDRTSLQVSETDEHWMIPRGIIPSDLEARAHALKLVQVGSDAMEPDIARTDVVIVDTGPATLTSEGIWLLGEGTAQVLRRVILTSREGQPCAILRASNKHYPDQFVSPDELQIVGRCVARFTLF